MIWGVSSLGIIYFGSSVVRVLNIELIILFETIIYLCNVFHLLKNISC
jgi:hypothetical protein